MEVAQQKLKFSQLIPAVILARSVVRMLVLVLIVWPATASTVAIGFASGWSFTEAARWVFAEQAASQRLGKAESTDSLLVKQCIDPSTQISGPASLGPMPQIESVVCQNIATNEVSIDEAAADAGHKLKTVYLYMVMLGLLFWIIFFLDSRTRASSNKSHFGSSSADSIGKPRDSLR